MWTKILIGVMAALNALVLLLNAGIKKYVEKKAEHLATKEDLRELIEEVREKAVASKEGEITAIQNKLDIVVGQNERIVKSSEEIREKISSRQRMWELKREAAYDIVKEIGVLIHLHTLSGTQWEVFKEYADSTKGTEAMIEVKELEAQIKSSIGKFWQLEGIASILFETDVIVAVKNIGPASVALLSKINAKTSQADAIALVAEFAGVCGNTIYALQQELKKEPA